MAGRPRARTVIVPVDEVLDDDAIGNENVCLLVLIPQISDELRTLEWLARRRLIHNSVVCPTCQQPATLNRYMAGP